MKKQILALSSFFAMAEGFAQMPADQQQAITLRRTIERKHYSPRAVDDSFSTDVFKKVITSLDAQSMYFTADEYNRLSAYRLQLDDELNGSSWKFLPALTDTYTRALKRADSIVERSLNAPLDFNTDEKGTINAEGRPRFAASVAELGQFWMRRFKWQLLLTAYDQWLANDKKGSFRETVLRHEAASRQKIKRQALAGIRQFENQQAIAAHVREQYLVALSESYDRHTHFFSPAGMERFKSELSTEDRIFGFLLDDKEGKIVVGNLVPGSPAWRSGEIHANDQVLQATIPGKEPEDASLLTADELDELIDRSASESVTLKLRRGDGTVYSTTLRKEKVTVEENGVKGYLLKGERTVGYIELPDFYTAWGGEGGSGCAGDVAREIYNLKKEGIQGLILDLRYNGGGSMGEALQLAGLFVDEGPLFGVRDRTGKHVFLKDPNRGTSWDGPLLVLINGQSASASESLAGTLQDYHRAVIVGSGTFGKATMQQVIPVDTADERNNNPAFGFVKVTEGKLYRLDGSTAQLQGVRPDIALPDAFDVLEYRERNMPNVLPADTARRNNYYKALPALPIGELDAASRQRRAQDAAFRELDKTIAQLAAFYRNKRQVVSLKLEAFEKWRTENDKEEAGNETRTKAASVFSFANYQKEQERLANNTFAREVNEATAKSVTSDIHIEEAYRIINDLIKRTNK